MGGGRKDGKGASLFAPAPERPSGSLCTDVTPPSVKIGRGDVCEPPTIIVFPFPRNVGDSLSLVATLMP